MKFPTSVPGKPNRTAVGSELLGAAFVAKSVAIQHVQTQNKIIVESIKFSSIIITWNTGQIAILHLIHPSMSLFTKAPLILAKSDETFNLSFLY